MLIGSIKPLQAPYLKSFLFARRNEKSFSHTWISFQSTQEKPQKPVSGKSPLILIHLTFLFYWDSVPNPDTPCGLCVLHVFAVANTRTRPVVWWPVSIPLSPFSRGHIRASGLSIASWLSLPANSGPASDDALFGTRGRRLRSRRAWSSQRLLVAGHDCFREAWLERKPNNLHLGWR